MTSSTEVDTTTTTTIATTVISTQQPSIHTTETTIDEQITTTSGSNASSLLDGSDSENTIAVVGGVCGAVGVIVILVIVIFIARRRGWIKKLHAPHMSSQKSDFDDKQPQCDVETEKQNEDGRIKYPQDENLTSEKNVQQNKQEVNPNPYMKMHFKEKNRSNLKDQTPNQSQQDTATATEVKSQPYTPMDFKQKIHFFENAKDRMQNSKTSKNEKLPHVKHVTTDSDYENESFSSAGMLVTKIGHEDNNKTKDKKVEDNEYSYAEVEVVNEIDEQRLTASKFVSPKLHSRELVTSGQRVVLPLDENEYVVLETSSNTTNDSTGGNVDDGYFILAKDESYNNKIEENSRSNTTPEVNRVLESVDNSKRNKATRANKDDDIYYSYCTTEELQTCNQLNKDEKRPKTFPVKFDKMTSLSSETASDDHIYSSADC